MKQHSATYSPEDNKLRITPAYRLDADDYARVKAAGFTWAPKQGLFVAGMWTPYREDLCIDLCGEIGDEDKSLMDRAEDRAERFEDYSEKRTDEAEHARKAVSAIADNIPLGQPILIGHHSEKRARRDAAKIENGMRRAVGLWETAQYWKSRAASAIAHAKYKELPAVRARRIKGLEADQRKQQKTKEQAERYLAAWTKDGLTHQEALAIASTCWLHLPRKAEDRQDHNGNPTAYDALTNSYPSLYAPRTLEEIIDAARRQYPRTIAHCTRWLTHLENRLTYERAMLEEAGGLPATQQKMEIGGQVLRRHGEWFIITKVNAGSVSVRGHFASTIPFDEIKDYRPPQPGDAEKVKAATKLPPMCNYPGEGFTHMTRKEWEGRQWSDWPKSAVLKATETAGAHRVRCTPGKNWKSEHVYLTDEKRKDPPMPTGERPALPVRHAKEPRPIVHRQEPEPTVFDALKESLEAGVQIVTAPQLFPTPPELAARMVEEADIQPGHRILEPSGGTGNLLAAIGHTRTECAAVAVELNECLAKKLAARFMVNVEVKCADFLACNGELGTFDRILMNPPFENGADIKHILHARHMLNPGGRLVALCANGPRQQEALQPLAAHWEALPAGSFKDEGTMVNVALLIIDQDEPTLLTLF